MVMHTADRCMDYSSLPPQPAFQNEVKTFITALRWGLYTPAHREELNL